MTGKVIVLDLDERGFEQILDDNRMFDVIEDTLRALQPGQDHNVGDSDLRSASRWWIVSDSCSSTGTFHAAGSNQCISTTNRRRRYRRRPNR